MMIKTAEYLALVRKKTGLSDYKIAKKFGINQSNLSKYSRGVATLSETHAFLFANILGLNPAEVIAHAKLERAQKTKNKAKIEFWRTQLAKLSENPTALRITIAQMNPTVGDLDGNAAKIIHFCEEARERDFPAHLVVFPELALCGYPPEDLLLGHEFLRKTAAKIEEIKTEIPDNLAIIFGAPHQQQSRLWNAAFVIINREIKHIYHKIALPNYGVFDEKRYFSSGDKPLVFSFGGEKIGVMICEDAWRESLFSQTAGFGAETIITLNASPFQSDQFARRTQTIRAFAQKNRVRFIYANMVGGQDELVFDGGSFALDASGKMTDRLPFFKTALETLGAKNSPPQENPSDEKMVYDALVLATKDYLRKNNFDGAIVGLSGGIDSALTLAIATDALGAENVRAVMMPSPHTKNESIEDAKSQASTLGVQYDEIDIAALMQNFDAALLKIFNPSAPDVAEENIQARIRGALLMAISNKSGHLVLATGNKSEMAVGYATLYGDMSGGFAPLKDVAKTSVWRLSHYRNTLGAVIPPRVLSKEPSAELAPGQLDRDHLPPYDILDKILQAFIEHKKSVAEIVAQGFDAALVQKITQMVLKNEYKRRQAAPGPKISPHAFGRERRYPITAKFQP